MSQLSINLKCSIYLEIFWSYSLYVYTTISMEIFITRVDAHLLRRRHSFTIFFIRLKYTKTEDRDNGFLHNEERKKGRQEGGWVSECVRRWQNQESFLFFCDSNSGGRELVHNYRPTSVTRFGKMSPLRQKSWKLWQFFKGQNSIWHNLTKFCKLLGKFFMLYP